MEAMRRDVRETPLYREAELLYQALRQPGTGQITDVAELQISPDGKFAAFAGTLMDALKGALQTRICQVELATGDVRVLTFGPGTDRSPKYSPDGRYIAFLSDRHEPGNLQLYLLDRASGAARSSPVVEGWVEYLHWSPDGQRLLLGVAGHGADIAGGQGAITSKRIAENLPSWMPSVHAVNEEYRWRRAWVYEVATDRAHTVSPPHLNIWEAVWCGNKALAAVASPGPGEGLWYSARLYILDLRTGAERELYAPPVQIGCLAASPSGHHLAVVEAICSDRGVVAGELLLIETATGGVQRSDTRRVDITCAEWRSEWQLLLAGHRGFEAVVGLLDARSGAFGELWCSQDLTITGRYAHVSGCAVTGDCVLATESFRRAPEIGVIGHGEYRTVRSLDAGNIEHINAIESVQRVTWKAPDGLEIQGWLLQPGQPTPHPLVMYVHGGPVWQWRPTWLGRTGVPMLMLLKHGYAIFLPNPRGSSGRGRNFARHVLGDMGGADTHDYLSGLDHLVAEGIADPTRIGVSGASYGGFMSAWLITQSSRFAAAVPVAPLTNHVTEHFISNIPHFVEMFLGDVPMNRGGKYFERSPLMHAHKVRTPTLQICGALDRCAPPEEAVQFHSALQQNGAESVLVTYPEEGHGIRKLPAAIDYAARVVDWFASHIPSAGR